MKANFTLNEDADLGRDARFPVARHGTSALSPTAILAGGCVIAGFLMLAPQSFATNSASAASAGFELTAGDQTLVVRPQTSDEAYQYLVRVLGDMDFFQTNGYHVALPDHPAFAPDVNPLGSREVFAREVYEPAHFENAMERLSSDRKLLSEALDWFAAAADLEGFRAFQRYEVTLTLYGPGGSFDPETGGIVLFTTPQGGFKGGGGTHTIVHEMMHLAVDDGLVQRFGLGHWEKERLVDLLVQREFADSLPDYSLQSDGEIALDPYLESASLAQMVEALQRYRAGSEDP